MEKKFIVGIDLGTTNSSVSYIDLDKEKNCNYRINKFEIPQLIAPSKFLALPVLPSFLYIPGDYDISTEDMVTPWKIEQRKLEDKNFVGKFAKDQGTKVPSRLVASAKSWICNKYVDKKARILPWGSSEDVFKISPVQALASYLKHIRTAWNISQSNNDLMYLENQKVIITVPASFDEIARDMTLESAKIAGLYNVLLLEEPLAAFYSWLSENENKWLNYIKPKQVILVCDVGGGTTDFTLICLKNKKGNLYFERLAVGDHLMLGGDNVDIAIAEVVAKQLYEDKSLISNDNWNSLCYQCCKIKEKVLNGEATSGKITITGEGSSLISNTLTYDIYLEDIKKIVLNFFFPIKSDPIHRSNDYVQNIHKYGLPYEKNISITHHLRNFLKQNQTEIKKILGLEKQYPDVVLFNGGSLRPKLIRDRIISFLTNEFDQSNNKPIVIKNKDINSAVSIGASYYGLVKSGYGLKIGSGSSRAFYIGVQTRNNINHNPNYKSNKAICLVERGLEEGSSISLPKNNFEVLANQPIVIEIYSSSFRSGDRCGDVVEIDSSLTTLPPVHTIIQLGGKKIKSKIPIQIEAIYTEIGTLELWCNSVLTPHKWQLKFQLKDSLDQSDLEQSEIFDNKKIKLARNLIQFTFTNNINDHNSDSLMKNIANIVERKKQQWPIGMVRNLADTALSYTDVRSVSAVLESRWMNFVGFCLRPGIGEGFDPYRIKKIWKFYKQGPVHANNLQVRLEWWIMWRRIAAGLNPGKQRQFLQDVTPIILDKKKHKKSKQEKIELWMTSANMEGIDVKDKVRMGRQLISEIISEKPKPQFLWALSRLGARNLLYSSIDRVVGYKEISTWLIKIISTKWRNPKPVIEMVSLMSEKTGDQIRDIKPELRQKIIEWINSFNGFTNQIEKINNVVERNVKEQKIIFGESIPSGIIFKF